jgi:hypothetical protein
MLKRASIIFLFGFSLLQVSVSFSKDPLDLKAKDQLAKIITNLETDSILILSIPSGKQVHLAPDMGKNEDEKEEGWTPVVDSHKVLDENNLKGTTPLLLRNMKPGKYLVGISPIVVMGRNRRLGEIEIDSTLKAESIVVYGGVPMPMDILNKDRQGAVVYSIQKEALKSLQVIIIAYPKKKGLNLNELKNIYPDDEVFEFNEPDFVSDFKFKAGALVTENQINDITALLKRGGKIAFYTGDFIIHAEIETKDTWKIGIKMRIPKK